MMEIDKPSESKFQSIKYLSLCWGLPAEQALNSGGVRLQEQLLTDSVHSLLEQWSPAGVAVVQVKPGKWKQVQYPNLLRTDGKNYQALKYQYRVLPNPRGSESGPSPTLTRSLRTTRSTRGGRFKKTMTQPSPNRNLRVKTLRPKPRKMPVSRKSTWRRPLNSWPAKPSRKKPKSRRMWRAGTTLRHDSPTPRDSQTPSRGPPARRTWPKGPKKARRTPTTRTSSPTPSTDPVPRRPPRKWGSDSSSESDFSLF